MTAIVQGRSKRELNISHMYDCTVTAELHVGLGYKASCGHASRTYSWRSKLLALVLQEIID